MTELKQTDLDLINELTNLHVSKFEDIKNKIPIQTKSGSFLYNVLEDYIYLMDDYVLDEPDVTLSEYYHGDSKRYAQEMLKHIENARNSIINIFILFVDSEDELESITPDYMSDVSSEYLYSLGEGAITKEPDVHKIDLLTEEQKIILNYYLVKTGFDEIEY